MKRFPRIRRDVIPIVPIQNMSGKWESSGATEHTKECQRQFDRLRPKTVRISPSIYKSKIRAALEINRLKTINEKEKTFTHSFEKYFKF